MIDLDLESPLVSSVLIEPNSCLIFDLLLLLLLMELTFLFLFGLCFSFRALMQKVYIVGRTSTKFCRHSQQ